MTEKQIKKRSKNSFKRGEDGLLASHEYIFNDDGSIDWRAMIGQEHLFPNKNWFQLRSQDVPNSIDGLRDDQLLIKLSGIKELARLRGFSDVSYKVVKCELDHVAVVCRITFLPNYETDGEPVVFEDMANASLNNTYDFGQNFLETIAANRAFVRCIRNFLNVHIVGSDEIGPPASAQKASAKPSLSPQSMLESLFDGDFDKFLSTLREFWVDKVYKHDSASSWKQFSDIPVKEARVLVKLVKEK